MSPKVEVCLCECPFYEKKFCHNNSWRDLHGNGYGNVNVFGLGGIDPCCAYKILYMKYPHSRSIQVELEGF